MEDNRRWTFSLEEALLLWTHILVKNVLMLDLFQLLSSPDVNWWTGEVWVIVMFLSAVWTLILTAPIHCRASIAETLMQRHISTNLMKKQTHPNLGWPDGGDVLGELFFECFVINIFTVIVKGEKIQLI